MELAGKDGKVRIGFQLGWGDKPSMAMNDEKMEGRIMLGFVQFDAPSPQDDNWALQFRSRDVKDRQAAILGMWRDYQTSRISGSILLRDSNGKKWSAP